MFASHTASVPPRAQQKQKKCSLQKDTYRKQGLLQVRPWYISFLRYYFSPSQGITVSTCMLSSGGKCDGQVRQVLPVSSSLSRTRYYFRKQRANSLQSVPLTPQQLWESFWLPHTGISPDCFSLPIPTFRWCISPPGIRRKNERAAEGALPEKCGERWKEAGSLVTWLSCLYPFFFQETNKPLSI